jgi:hypothetical protein
MLGAAINHRQSSTTILAQSVSINFCWFLTRCVWYQPSHPFHSKVRWSDWCNLNCPTTILAVCFHELPVILMKCMLFQPIHYLHKWPYCCNLNIFKDSSHLQHCIVLHAQIYLVRRTFTYSVIKLKTSVFN